MCTLAAGPALASAKEDHLPAQLKQFAKEQGLEFTRVNTVNGRTYFEFTKDGQTVVISEEFALALRDHNSKAKRGEITPQHDPGSHYSFWRAFDWFSRSVSG
jgi:hypothetical protein